MKILVLETKEELDAEVKEVNKEDFQRIKASKQFVFDWEEERPNHIFKLVVVGDDTGEIHGLISLTNIANELRIHVNLIENSNTNKGINKKVDRVAGCMLAFAVKLAFENGYYGFTSLIPKTELIKLYTIKYGFRQFGRQLAFEGQDAIDLLNKYL